MDYNYSITDILKEGSIRIINPYTEEEYFTEVCKANKIDGLTGRPKNLFEFKASDYSQDNDFIEMSGFVYYGIDLLDFRTNFNEHLKEFKKQQEESNNY